MKSKSRALLTAATLLGFVTIGANARADPKQECADAYEKTQSFRDGGQLIEARKQAVACSAPTCSVYMTKDCLQWVTEIDALLPTVVFTATDTAGASTLAVRIAVDGQALITQLDGTPVRLDPGEHVVRFEIDGADAIEQKVTIQASEKNRTLTASFKKSPPPPPPAPLPAPPPSPSPPPILTSPKSDASQEPAADGASVPVWAWVSGGAGLVSLGVSTVFGASALSAQNRLVTACGGDPARCPEHTQTETVPLAAQRTQDRNVFLGLAAAGVVGVGAAIIGIATAPSKASTPRTSFVLAPYGSPSSGGLMLQGQF
jgi:hypothetical protein